VSCGEWEARIALLVEGDLPDGEAGAVEAHLAGCAGCRRFAEELRESQRDLRSLGEEDPDRRALAAVRRRVLEALDRPARRSPVFVALAAAAGIVALAVFLSWEGADRLSEPPAPAPVTTAARPVPAEIPPPSLAPVEPERQATSPAVAPSGSVRRPARRLVMMVEPAPPVAEGTPPEGSRPAIKIVTSDPDVVIYWVTDPEGGSS
jgi:hypothetical protein